MPSLSFAGIERGVIRADLRERSLLFHGDVDSLSAGQCPE